MMNFASRKVLVLTVILPFQAVSAANPWEAVSENQFIPHNVSGGQCADGSEYRYYVREGDPSKVLIHFQGGGACWNAETCFGPVPFTRLKDKGIKRGTVFHSELEADHPFKNFTYVFLPYCTGDIFAGTHSTQYLGQPINHLGRNNVTLALGLLENEQNKLVSQASKLVVYGDSAGALGAMLNMDQVDPLSSLVPDRTMIIDSAGLHFSERIWKRFDKEYIADLQGAMIANGMKLDLNSGLVSRQTKDFCDHYPKWKLGIIQSTQDIVMSVIFGERTQQGHKRKVLGLWGLDRKLKSLDYSCSSFIPDAGKHVWALDEKGWNAKTKDQKRLGDYVLDLVNGRLQDEYPSHK